MKLPIAARELLRQRLSCHPDIEQHVPPSDSIQQMQKQELLSLAKRLRIDVRAIIEEVKRDHRGPEAFFDDEDLARFRYSNANPAFSGTLEFELEIGALGKKASRKARILWGYTPNWKYFDPKQQRVVQGWPGLAISLVVFAVPGDGSWEMGRDGKFHESNNVPVWTRVDDLLEDGVLTIEMLDEIDERIDQMTQREDAVRRANRRRQKSSKDASGSAKIPE